MTRDRINHIVGDSDETYEPVYNGDGGFLDSFKNAVENNLGHTLESTGTYLTENFDMGQGITSYGKDLQKGTGVRPKQEWTTSRAYEHPIDFMTSPTGFVTWVGSMFGPYPIILLVIIGWYVLRKKIKKKKGQAICKNYGKTISATAIGCLRWGIRWLEHLEQKLLEKSKPTSNIEKVSSSDSPGRTIIAHRDTISDRIKLLVMAVILSIISIGWYFYNIPHNEPIVVTSSKILSDYKRDPKEAGKRYTDKIVTIKGEIAKKVIDKKAGTILVIKNSTAKEMLMVMVPKSHPEWEKQLTSGHAVQITGVCVGKSDIPQTKDAHVVTVFMQSLK